MEYSNPPSVAVALIGTIDGGLVLIRRALPDGKGLWALPGGYQEMGESLAQAAAREVYEETGLLTDAFLYSIYSTSTVEQNTINLVAFDYALWVKSDDLEFINLVDESDESYEIAEVRVWKEPPEDDQIAFATHRLWIKEFFSEVSATR